MRLGDHVHGEVVEGHPRANSPERSEHRMRNPSWIVLAASLIGCVGTGQEETTPGMLEGEAPSELEAGAGGLPGGSGDEPSTVGGAPSGPGEAQGGAINVQMGQGPMGQGPMGQGGVQSTGGGAPVAPPGGTPCVLPSSFRWTSSDPIIAPVSDPAHDLVAIKDPTVVFFNERWHVYASSVSTTGVYGMVYLSFADFRDASSAPLYYMDQTPGFATYVAAPQVFYFAPQARWYLVFQSGPPMFSTNDDPGNPESWTPPAPFFAAEPAIITQNGGWLDYWVICDDARCHLFFSDDHGRWYRSVTAIGDFPRGFTDPEIVMQDPEAGRLFEGSNVYKVQGTDQYLALIEAFDSTSNWRRYFRSWTSSSLDGPWVPLQDSGSAPFAAMSNVSFTSPAWANDISHGELIRAGYDQTLALDACNLQFLYQAFDASVEYSNYNAIPWRLGLLTAAR
jgi:endo-1,4-beta-xylanase